MFKKWHAERTPLHCQIPLRQIAAAFNVRVYSVSEQLLLLASDDLLTELNIPLRPSLSFGYGDASNDPGEKRYSSMVLIFLEPIPPAGLGDMVVIYEFQDPPSEV
jgi:hypothetical protein